MSLARLRRLSFLGFVMALAVLLGSVVLEMRIGLLPCPLCQSQRLFLALYALACLGAVLHGPAPSATRRYRLLALACAMAGAALAARHVWLQGEWSPSAECPASLAQVLQKPWREVLWQLLVGGPDCVSITWSFLDLTLPEWSLLAFLLLAALPLSRLLAYRFRNLGTG
ncbi:disulfide bond formation protein B [Pseudomonas entomophila]|uniref:disulfide bond formation protein B n=1 Tax=Pseudomonas entomophila TaxID=312306 RepID=UPI0023D83865|nr:disulfide bond formation protein B [Pseudomonas entomophila]MDF0734201.1 disulfide bond formation protein B [Pseudomonas entomophila]